MKVLGTNEEEYVPAGGKDFPIVRGGADPTTLFVETVASASSSAESGHPPATPLVADTPAAAPVPSSNGSSSSSSDTNDDADDAQAQRPPQHEQQHVEEQPPPPPKEPSAAEAQPPPPPPLLTITPTTESNSSTTTTTAEGSFRAKPTPPSQRLRRKTPLPDPLAESSAVQRLVEYFCVISCRPGPVSPKMMQPQAEKKLRSSGSGRKTTPKTSNSAGTEIPTSTSFTFSSPELNHANSKGSISSAPASLEKAASADSSTTKQQPSPPSPGSKGRKSPAAAEAEAAPVCFHPKITARYPTKDHRDNPLNPMILQFCFPTGDEIVPVQQYQLPRVHYFVLTNEKGRKVYGICLTLMEDYQQAPAEEASSDIDSTRAGIEVSDVPKPPATTTLYLPKVLCLLSTWPYLTAFREYLAQLYRLATATNVMTAPIERYIGNLCCEIPAPPPGAYEIQVSILDSTIRFWAPPAKLPIAYVALPYSILFECLDLEHILDLFCALIMEHKIVLLSSQYSILTICSEILCSLLFPMRWSHLYIPVLPKMLLPMLDAPVPYICGVVRENWTVAQENLASDAIVVDLDNNTITLGRDTQTIPAPPAKKWQKLMLTLQQALGNIYERAHGHDLKKAASTSAQTPNPTMGTGLTLSARKPPRQPSVFARMRETKDGPAWAEKLESWDSAFNLAYTPNSELMDDIADTAGYGTDGQTQWDKVQEAFLRFFVALFKDYRKYLEMPKGRHAAANTRPSFDVVGFLESQPPVNQPFVQAMCMSQQFDDFITRRMYSPGEPELLFFDQSIDAKLNRSKLKLKKVETPFVQNAKAHKVLKHYKAIEPNEEGLTDFNFDRMLNPYIYKTWPDTFDESLFSRPRPIPKMIAAEFDRQAMHVSQLRIEASNVDVEEDEAEFFGGDYDTSPEVGAFTVFFFTYSALVGLEWQQYKEKNLTDANLPRTVSNVSNISRETSQAETTEPQPVPPLTEEVEAVIQEHQAGKPPPSPAAGADHHCNDHCVSDLTLGFCNTQQGMNGIRSTLVLVNKGAEDAYAAIFKDAAERMKEIQRTLSAEKDDQTDGEKGEARAEYEEAREVASAQLDLAFETLKTLSLRGLPADLDAYKSLMGACGRCGDASRAQSLIELMKKDGFVLDGEILSCFVAAFAHEEVGALGDISFADTATVDEELADVASPRKQQQPRQEPRQDAYSASIRKGLVAMQEEKKEADNRPWLGFGGSLLNRKRSESSDLEDTASVTSHHTADTDGSSIVFGLLGTNDPRNRKEIAKRRRRRRKKFSKDKKVTPMLATQLDLGQTLLEFLHPDLQIDTNKQACPHCSYTLAEDEVIAGWTPCSFDDFTTKCTKCAHRFVPHFSVSCSAPTFKGSQGPGSALFCEFLSPWVVRKALHHVIKGGDVGIQGMLDPEWRSGTDIRATLYWNLIVLCKRYNLPFTFLLQGSVQGRIILPRMPQDM